MTTHVLEPGPERQDDARLRLVAVDVDGCLSGGESQPIDLDVLRLIGGLNDRSQNDPFVPGITYITGRGAEYVEVIQQLTRGYLPVIYEVGSAALLPREYRFVYNPSLAATAVEDIRQARELLWDTLGKAKRAYYQPGLELTLSIYPIAPVTMQELNRQVVELFRPFEKQLQVQQSRTCVDVVPQGTGKDPGIRWLSQLAGVPLSAMAGIGDSLNDLDFLELVAFSGAPANASSEVKRIVDYVSPYPEGKGVHDFLEKCLAYNRVR